MTPTRWSMDPLLQTRVRCQHHQTLLVPLLVLLYMLRTVVFVTPILRAR